MRRTTSTGSSSAPTSTYQGWEPQGVALEPFRETGYRRLMRLHHRAGDRGEALRVYERCRRLLAEEVGVAVARDGGAGSRGRPQTPHAGRRRVRLDDRFGRSSSPVEVEG